MFHLSLMALGQPITNSWPGVHHSSVGHAWEWVCQCFSMSILSDGCLFQLRPVANDEGGSLSAFIIVPHAQNTVHTSNY